MNIQNIINQLFNTFKRGGKSNLQKKNPTPPQSHTPISAKQNQDDDNDTPLDPEPAQSIDENTDLLGETDYAIYKANLKNIPPAIVLLVGKPELIGKQWLLASEIEILGRSSSSSIIINDSSISKSHLKFQITAEHIVSVIDLQSTNGLIINSQKQTPLQPIALKNNDQIKLGNLVFKFLEKGNVETVSSSKIYQKSLIDSLTNISNKAAFESNITSRMLLKNPFSLIIFDIDHFKKINDTYGHLCGDFILTEMSKFISENLIRDEDFLSRYGGEEFCLIVPQKISLAQEIAERLRKSIDNYNFNFQDKELHVSISLGVTEKNISDTLWADVFDRADKALYKSKANGRNKVTIA